MYNNLQVFLIRRLFEDFVCMYLFSLLKILLKFIPAGITSLFPHATLIIMYCIYVGFILVICILYSINNKTCIICFMFPPEVLLFEVSILVWLPAGGSCAERQKYLHRKMGK